MCDKRTDTVTKDVVKQMVRDILNSYLEVNGHRKTPERYAILDAVYDIDGHFTLEQMSDYLEQHSFRVSRATLYNTMRLFIKLRLVVRHRFIGKTVYEGCFDNEKHCHQVCTICGKVTEVNSREIEDAINATRLKRFRKDGFTLYIYGVCTTCQTRLSKQRNKLKQQQNNNKK